MTEETVSYAFAWGELALIPAALAGLLHIYIWAMESLVFQTKGRKVFGLTADQASDQRVRQLFFNQGFYNLFLAVGALVGVALTLCSGDCVAGTTLLWFTMASMLGAAVVLVADDRTMLRGALVQGTFPALALLLLAIDALTR